MNQRRNNDLAKARPTDEGGALKGALEGALSGDDERHTIEVEVGNRLVHIRGRESQAGFASLVGVHKNTWGNYERGMREIGAEALRGLARLGWSPLWILTGEGDERLSPNAIPGAATDTALVVARGDKIAEARRDDYIKALSAGGYRKEKMVEALVWVQEALNGRWLAPAEHAELIDLAYSQLISGQELPGAKIIRLVQAASGEPNNAGQEQQDSRDPARRRRGAKGGDG